ncbi:MAG: restriction endonuclease subunit S [Desulfomonilia bacterium]|jgi:type I restriction enzyme S subunit
MKGNPRRSVKLGDLFTIKHGYAFKGEHFGTEGSHIVLTPGNFFDEGGFKKKGDKEKWYSGKIPEDYILFRGDLLVAMTEQAEGLLGSSAIVPEGGRYLHNQRLGLIQNFNDVDKRFLYYLFNSQTVRQQIRASCSGVKVRHTSPSRIYDVKVAIPPLPTQRKIAAILSAYDDLIENNLQRIKILEKMAQNLYREWFVKLRFPGHQHARFVDSPLGRIPEGWEVVALEDVCSRITDGSHHSPKSVEFGYPMASVKDMHDWGINIDTCRKISEDDFQNLVRNDCKMLKDDVLIAKDGSYLKHCFVVEKDLDVALLSSIAMLRPNKRINPHVLAMILREPDMKIRMTGFVSGAALPRIILQAFRQFQIILPHIALQERWAASAEPMIQLCWRLLNANANLRCTRNLMLPMLISGEVDVSELDITVSEEAA